MPSPCPTVCRRPPLVAAPCTSPAAAADITDPALAADIRDPALAAEAMLKADAIDPMDPIDKALPTDPMLSTDPRLAMHRIESSEAMDHFDGIATRCRIQSGRAGVGRAQRVVGKVAVARATVNFPTSSGTCSTGGGQRGTPRCMRRGAREPSRR